MHQRRAGVHAGKDQRGADAARKSNDLRSWKRLAHHRDHTLIRGNHPIGKFLLRQAPGPTVKNLHRIGARFLQGIGAAAQASVILAIIITEFPEAADRARAMSAYVFVSVAGGSLGLLLNAGFNALRRRLLAGFPEEAG